MYINDAFNCKSLQVRHIVACSKHLISHELTQNSALQDSHYRSV